MKEGVALPYGKKGGIEAEGWYRSPKKLNAGVVARPPMTKSPGKRLSSSKDPISPGQGTGHGCIRRVGGCAT